jgi:cell division protein ZapA
VATTKGIAVKILGKDYQVACPEEEVHRLIDASLLLDSKMKDIKASGRVIGLERIAVMAALNLAHELQINKERSTNERAATDQRIVLLHDKLEDALTVT